MDAITEAPMPAENPAENPAGGAALKPAQPPTQSPQRPGSWWRTAPRSRWVVPGVVAAVVAGAIAVPALAAAADDDLPDVTPTELLADVVQAEPSALSGTAVFTTRLGLPDLGLGDLADAGPASLLGGSSTVRVWTDGADRSRLAILGGTSEYSMVRDGLEAWSYSSADNEVVHFAPSAEDAAMLEQLMGDHASDATAMPGALADPEQLARTVLTIAEQYSTVSMDADTTVAGRDAYQLVVTPTTAQTLVARIVVAVDAETSMPLRLQVWSTQDAAAPALEVGFTDITFGAPDPAVLEFSVPVGATVREETIPVPDLGTLAGLGGGALSDELGGLADLDLSNLSDLQSAGDLDPAKLADLVGIDPAELERIAGLDGPERLAAMRDLMAGADLGALTGQADPAQDGAPAADAPDATPAEGLRLLGEGWATVVELSGVDTAGADTAGADGAGVDTAGTDTAGTDADPLSALATTVPEGRLISSALLSILLTDDGRVLIGAVPGEVLRQLA